MTDNEIVTKFRQALRNCIDTDGLTPEEIEEIINEAYTQAGITDNGIVEQFRMGETNGISGETQFDILNLLTIKAQQNGN